MGKKRKRVLENIYEESKKFKDEDRLDDSALLEEASDDIMPDENAPPAENSKNQTEESTSDEGSDMSLGSIIDNIESVMDKELSNTSTPSSNLRSLQQCCLLR